MGQIRDLENFVFGRWKVLRLFGFTQSRDKNGRWYRHKAIWTCLCDPELGGCGIEKEVVGTSLTARNRRSRSCGCWAAELAAARLKGITGPVSIGWPNRILPGEGLNDLKGKCFGKWLVIERVENDSRRHVRFLCECSCPLRTRRVVLSSNLLNGSSQSCCGSKRWKQKAA